MREGFKKAKEIGEKFSTPVLVCSTERIREKYLLIRKLLPDVFPYYAVKANPHPKIVEQMVKLGMGLDVSSPGELSLAKDLGLTGEKVIYTRPIKKIGEIELARDYGVKTLIFDNINEIEKISEVWKGAPVLLRLKVKNPFCVVNLSEKFGAEPGQAKELMKYALSLGLKPKGLAFHVGSQTTNPLPYIETLKIAKRLFDIFSSEGFEMEILDIGGGFPVVYKEPVMAIEHFIEPANQVVENYFSGIEVISEPGRFMIGDSCYLIASVVGKAKRKGMNWYYIDDGLYGSFSGKVYDHADYPIVTEREGKKRPSVIAGPTCDSFDVTHREVLLPELEIGDFLIFPSMGAYTASSASNFNGIEKTKIILEEEI